MSGRDLHEQVAALELKIEELSRALERCRKLTLVAKASIAVGGVLLVATVSGMMNFEGAAMIFAIAAVLGGVVLLGSNRTTQQQTAAALATAETALTRLIDEIDPRPVADANAGGGRPRYGD